MNIRRFVLGAAFGLGLIGVAPLAHALPLTIADNYEGGTAESSTYGDVIGDPNQFQIYSMTVTRVGNGLTVDILTNYSAGNVGAVNTSAGALFLGELGKFTPNGPLTGYNGDIFYDGAGGHVDDVNRFSHALDFNGSNPTDNTPASGGATLWKLTETASDVITTFYAGDPNSRNHQAYDVNTTGKTSVGSGGWSTTTNHFVFEINDFFTNTLLGGVGGIYELGATFAWTMLCGNDVYMEQFAWGPGGAEPVPLPAGLILLLGGLGGLGFLGRYKAKRAVAT